MLLIVAQKAVPYDFGFREAIMNTREPFTTAAPIILFVNQGQQMK